MVEVTRGYFSPVCKGEVEQLVDAEIDLSISQCDCARHTLGHVNDRSAVIMRRLPNVEQKGVDCSADALNNCRNEPRH